MKTSLAASRWLMLTVVLALLSGALIRFPVQAAQTPTFTLEVVVRQADFPVAMAFSPDGDLFYTEKNTGNVRRVRPDGRLQAEPVINLPTDSFVERGMIGIAVDPNYSENGYLWVYHTQPNTVQPPDPINRVVRFEVSAAEEDILLGSNPREMLAVPVTTRVGHHMGGNLRFDEDGFLYVSIGDYGEASFAQDIDAMPGRIHRFAVEGDALVPAPDNPFDNSTYAYGLRNPFDFDFDPVSGDILASENGPTCDDEINLILAGGNYGWKPAYQCGAADGSSISPLTSYTPPEALTGVLVYDGEMFPDWYGDVFYCGWVNGSMWRAEFNEARTLFERTERVPLNANCSTDVEVAPDGAIYFTAPDAIYRMVAG